MEHYNNNTQQKNTEESTENELWIWCAVGLVAHIVHLIIQWIRNGFQSSWHIILERFAFFFWWWGWQWGWVPVLYSVSSVSSAVVNSIPSDSTFSSAICMHCEAVSHFLLHFRTSFSHLCPGAKPWTTTAEIFTRVSYLSNPDLGVYIKIIISLYE